MTYSTFSIRSAALTTVALLFLMVLGVSTAQAQAVYSPRSYDKNLNIEANGGVALFGRFLEQQLDAGNRELEASTSSTWGVAVGVQPWSRFGFRTMASYSPTELIFENRFEGQEEEGLRNLDAWSFSAQGISYLLPEVERFTPYLGLGAAGVLWSIDDAPEAAANQAITADDDTIFRLGGVLTSGFEFLPHNDLSLRLEGNFFGVRNPFDGDESFNLNSDAPTIDQPEFVRMTQFTLGLTYTM